MTRTFKYRLLPTREQERKLWEILRLTREIYNAALEERRDAWKRQRKSISLYDQMAQLADVRESRPEFGVAAIAILRGALRRLDRVVNSCKK